MPDVLSYVARLNTSGFTGPLRQAESMVSSSVGKIGAAFAGLGVAFGAFKGIEGAFSGIAGVAAQGLELKKLSATTGQSVHDLVILQKAFEEAGIGADAVGQSLFMLQKSLGGVNDQGEPTKQVFEQLGLSIDALKGRPAIEQLESIAAAIGQLGSQEEKTAKIASIFGRFGGREMLALLGDPSQIREAATTYGEMADVIQKNAVAFAKLELAILKVKARIANIFVGLTEQIGPQLTALLDRLRNSFDGLKIGEKIGDAIRVALAAAEVGQLGDLIGLSIMAGIEKFTPVIQTALHNMFAAPSAYLQASFEQTMSRIAERIRLFGANPLAYAASAGFNIGRGITGNKAEEERLAKDLQERTAAILKQTSAEVAPASTEYLTKLQTLVESIKQSLAYLSGAPKTETPEDKKKREEKTAIGQTVGAKLSEGDRLAKIGGFIGGGANRMLDYTRDIARSAAQIAVNTKPKGGHNETPAATYA